MISVVIPTLDAGSYARRIVVHLAAQTRPPDEIVVIDSESSDGTAHAFRALGANVEQVERRSFHHATVRNRGAAQASGDVLVFMTQDALPADRNCVERLVAPLLDGMAAASFARQVPSADSSPLERFARQTNYPEQSRIVTEADVETLGVRAFFFSNSFSAIRRDVFEELGGFPTHTVMNEDMLFAARVLCTGGSIAYVADAVVEHSHRYTLDQTFRRYFDIGAVFAQAREEFAGVSLSGEGARYFGKLLTKLVRDGDYHWIPAAIAESAVKLMGVSLGKRYRSLPLAWTKRMSMNPQYWAPHR